MPNGLINYYYSVNLFRVNPSSIASRSLLLLLLFFTLFASEAHDSAIIIIIDSVVIVIHNSLCCGRPNSYCSNYANDEWIRIERSARRPPPMHTKRYIQFHGWTRTTNEVKQRKEETRLVPIIYFLLSSKVRKRMPTFCSTCHELIWSAIRNCEHLSLWKRADNGTFVLTTIVVCRNDRLVIGWTVCKRPQRVYSHQIEQHEVQIIFPCNFMASFLSSSISRSKWVQCIFHQTSLELHKWVQERVWTRENQIKMKNRLTKQ